MREKSISSMPAKAGHIDDCSHLYLRRGVLVVDGEIAPALKPPIRTSLS